MLNLLLTVRWDVSPYIFKVKNLLFFGDFGFRWYSLMFFLAFGLGFLIYKNMVIRENRPASLYNNILLPVFIATFLGARLGHYLFYETGTFFANPLAVLLPFKDGKFVGYQGLASHGAAIGILIGLYYYSRKNKVPYLWTLDRIVITIALSGFFIRTGNLMNSEVYGNETTVPWGFIFVRDLQTVPRHPTQIYEALAYLAIFVFLYLLYLKKRDKPLRDGVIFSLFLILLFGARFMLEFFKAVQEQFEESMVLDMGQILSIPLILTGIILLIKLYKQGLTVEPKPEPAPQVASRPTSNRRKQPKYKPRK